MDKHRKAQLTFILALFLWSTLGVIRRYIEFPSGLIALGRGFLAVLVLSVGLICSRHRFDWSGVKKNGLYIAFGGMLLGTNWALLFEAYQHTAVGTAELFYYTSPLFLIFLAPWLLHESITLRQIVCLVVAMIGMILVSGAYHLNISEADFLGIGLALIAALEVAFLIIVNKKISSVGIWENTLSQLCVATLILLPYTLCSGDLTNVVKFDVVSMLLVALVGVVHTGFAYCLYYGSLSNLAAREISLLGYLDPVLAVLWGWMVLGEVFLPLQILGAFLILGSLLISEIKFTVWISRKSNEEDSKSVK